MRGIFLRRYNTRKRQKGKIWYLNTNGHVVHGKDGISNHLLFQLAKIKEYGADVEVCVGM